MVITTANGITTSKLTNDFIVNNTIAIAKITSLQSELNDKQDVLTDNSVSLNHLDKLSATNL